VLKDKNLDSNYWCQTEDFDFELIKYLSDLILKLLDKLQLVQGNS
jgi:hypothetical protein